MTEIVKVTKEEFEAVEGRGRPASEVTTAILALDIDEGVRLVNHRHVQSSKSPTCSQAAIVVRSARKHGRTVATRHDGPDLLVMRVK